MVFVNKGNRCISATNFSPFAFGFFSSPSRITEYTSISTCFYIGVNVGVWESVVSIVIIISHHFCSLYRFKWRWRRKIRSAPSAVPLCVLCRGCTTVLLSIDRTAFDRCFDTKNTLAHPLSSFVKLLTLWIPSSILHLIHICNVFINRPS